jgi:signal transduction histidine kinase/CheY-like chemotaxis protein
LQEAFERSSRGIPVLKIVIYNIDGRTIYSSDHSEIGENWGLNPLFRIASKGKAVSELTRRGDKSVSEGEVAKFHIVSSYIPILGADGRVVAVFELYSDITAGVVRIRQANLRLLAGLIVLFACLYGILLLIVGRADRILHRQRRELTSKEIQISAKNRELLFEMAGRNEMEFALRESEEVAAKANQAKTDFLSNMSHELRTPLNAILGFAQLLETEPSAPLAPAQKRFVDQILKASRHLLQLINEILDLASIESGKMRLSLEAVEVSSVVGECLPLIQAMALKNQVTVSVVPATGVPRVWADSMKLKQSLLNLMSNAVKYNRVGGSVSVDVRGVPGHKIRITVQDTGVGIPLEMQGDLFRPFHRMSATALDVEGTGIGLALTRSIVVAMGGEIGFSSAWQQGSLFWIELPVAQVHERRRSRGVLPQTEAPVLSIAGMQRSLLYIEDNPANVLVMEELARRMSVRFIAAEDAERGIRLAAQELPDLIVMDINLPGMDGYEALARLRQDPATQHIPIMALSANAMDRDVMRGLEAGFIRYETKPYEVEDMIHKIGRLLAGGA